MDEKHLNELRAIESIAELEAIRDKIFDITARWLTGSISGDTAMESVMAINSKHKAS